MRDSRHGRELLVDGTFASFFRPGSAATGSVWDAIAAPLLLVPPARCRSVLVLGLGGGSVARLVRALAPAASIRGVELDPAVVDAARHAFGLDELGVDVVQDDALRFLERDRSRYDVILEDLFVGAGDAVHKPDWMPEPGLRLAAARLRPNGLLVSNTLDECPRVARHLKERFPRVLRIEVEDYDNRILAAGTPGLDARRLRRAVAASPVLRDTLASLSFRTLRGVGSKDLEAGDPA